MQVTWRSDYPLPCACGYAAPVVLCLRDGLVANYPTRNTIEASLLYSDELSCGNGYQHTFDYDPTLIVNEQQLFQLDITGAVCSGCWKEYVDDQVASAVCVVEVDNNALTRDENGCLRVLVSGAEDNALSIIDGALFATAGGGGEGWALTGNAGTVAGTNFLGTTDAVAHETKANSKRIRRIEYINDFGSIILDGAEGNESIPGLLLNAGCSILGGGGLPSPDHVFWVTDFNTIENGYFTTICGGRNNFILGDAINPGDDDPAVFVGNSIIGGGYDNYITNLGPSGFEEGAYYEGANGIFAGGRNLIQGASLSAICAGTDNGIDITDALDDTYSAGNFIGAGTSNYIQIGFGVTDTNFVRNSSITAGLSNYIENGFACHIGGGEDNEIYSNPSGTRIDDSCILGGATNQINDDLSSIHGGFANWITGQHSHIFGGGRLLMDDYCCGIQNYQTRTASSSRADLSAFTGVFYCGDFDVWIANTNNVARKIKFFEPNTDLDFSSAMFSSFRAAAQVANIEYIWPAAAGTVNQRLTITNVSGTTVTLGWAA